MRHETTPTSDFFLGNPVWSDQLFSGLPRKVRKKLAAATTFIRIPKGASLFSRGEIAGMVYTLVSGKAKLIVDTGAGRCLARRISSGEVFGLPEAVAEGVYETSVIADSDCLFEAVCAADFSLILHLSPQLSFRLVKVLGTNLDTGRRLLASLSA